MRSTLAQPGHESAVDFSHTRPARYEKQVGILDVHQIKIRNQLQTAGGSYALASE